MKDSEIARTSDYEVVVDVMPAPNDRSGRLLMLPMVVRQRLLSHDQIVLDLRRTCTLNQIGLVRRLQGFVSR